MSTSDIVLVIILIACVGLSGFFSGSETAFVAFPRERVPQKEDEKNWRRVDYRLYIMVEEIENTLGTLLIANNFVNILGASVGTILAIDFLLAFTSTEQQAQDWGPWLATLVMTATILVLGDITPKTLAARHPVRWARIVSAPIYGVTRIVRPLASFFLALGRGLLKIIGADRIEKEATSQKDVLVLATLGEREGDIEQAELEILTSLFDLADRPIRDVMTPRVEVIALEVGTTISEARREAAEKRHSRFPVTDSGAGLDHIIGMLYVKDLLGEPRGDIDIAQFVRPASYMPERVTVLSALDQMRREKNGVSLVLDEHGGVEGLVTLKDLIAELVGDIVDDDDPDEPSIVSINPSQWVVDGRVPVEDLANELELELPTGAYSTVGGLFMNYAGRVPQVGDQVNVDDLELTVSVMDKRRIARIRVVTENPTKPP